MQKIKDKTIAITIALFLTVIMSASLVLTPSVAAHNTSTDTSTWQIPTNAFIHVAPNPVGVGQQVLVVFWLDKVMPSAVVANAIRMHGYQLTITAPDGTVKTMSWDIVWDTTSSQYTPFTPDQAGIYKFDFNYPGQTYDFGGTYQGDKYLPANASTTLTVQNDQVPDAKTSYPLPTQYWTRPIEGMNTDWWAISSNWLGTGSPQFTGGQKIQRDGTAPNSPHIMWTKPIQNGGVMGGTHVGLAGETYYNGLDYNMRFQNAIIMYGRLFYSLPYGNSGTTGGVMAVDLRTGEQLWYTNTTGIGNPSFGYVYDYNDGNQHGGLGNDLLYTSNFARAYDPTTGIVTNVNITNTPGGTPFQGAYGEQLRYQIANIGTTASPNWRLTEWNSSKMNQVTVGQIGAGNWYLNGFYNASLAQNYDWNVSIPALSGLSAPTVVAAIQDDRIVGRSSSFQGTSSSTTFGTPDPWTYWAVSIKPESRGTLLWIKNYSAPAGNHTLSPGTVNLDSKVFIMFEKETGSWYGYSTDDGSLLWGPTPPLNTAGRDDFDYYNALESLSVNCPIYQGRFYASGYGGLLYCFDAKTGTLLWTYGNGGPGNSTNAGLTNVWGHYPLWIGVVADGKLYMYTSEHSPNSPMYKDALIRCLNATTGEEIWTMLGWGGVFGPTTQMVEADGYLAYMNSYDNQLYVVGKGPSQLTVSAPQAGIDMGKSLIISGSVTDISSGSKQQATAANFPNGLPCVSDESQAAWMEYVYMQKPKPTNATGVEVTINVLDSNGNLRPIGTATTDTSGMFSYQWTPDIQGKYTVFASFAGSESYWPSSSETSFAVDPAAPTPTPSPVAQQSVADQYFIPAIAGLFVAIIVVGAVMAILMLRKRP
jgi:outer membrane protein assembly factor BamB